MELRQLRCFDAVARHASFTRAARSLHVAQPAVSAQIRRLETELGVALFARTTRKVELTQAGELLRERVHRVLAELDGVRDDVEQLAGTVRGRVRIGAIHATAPYDLAAALAAFHRRRPGIDIVLRAGRMGHLLAELDADEIDLAIGPLRADLPGRLRTDLLFTDELVLVTAPDHPLAARGALPLHAVRDEPFLCLPADSGLRSILDRAAGAAGFTAHVPFEDADLPRLRDLAAHGLGVALIARSVAEAPGPPVAVHSLAPEPLHRPVGLVRRRDARPRAAVRMCHAFLADWRRRDRPAGAGAAPVAGSPAPG